MNPIIKTIPLAECRRLIESGHHPHILDVRTPAEFARVHAVGARLMPLDKLDPAAVAAQYSRSNDPIYVICHSGQRAAKACQRFQDVGLTNIYSIEGGTVAWEQMGLPVERAGGKVISLERQVRITAGIFILFGLIMAWAIHWAFLLIPALVGTGLIFAGVTDTCGMAMLLVKMPWNRRIFTGETQCSTTP